MAQKSHGCLLFFVIIFLLISGFTWFVTLTMIYGDPESGSSFGEALGEVIGRVIIAGFGLIVGAVATLIFLILFIVYLVKVNKN